MSFAFLLVGCDAGEAPPKRRPVAKASDCSEAFAPAGEA